MLIMLSLKAGRWQSLPSQVHAPSSTICLPSGENEQRVVCEKKIKNFSIRLKPAHLRVANRVVVD